MNNLNFNSSSLNSSILRLSGNKFSFRWCLLVWVPTGHLIGLEGEPSYVALTVMPCAYHMTQLYSHFPLFLFLFVFNIRCKTREKFNFSEKR